MDNFFSSLNAERFGKKIERSRARAKAGVFDYIEWFHKPTRRHTPLSYLGP